MRATVVVNARIWQWDDDSGSAEASAEAVPVGLGPSARGGWRASWLAVREGTIVAVGSAAAAASGPDPAARPAAATEAERARGLDDAAVGARSDLLLQVKQAMDGLAAASPAAGDGADAAGADDAADAADAEVVDAGGMYVLPGLHDAHIHAFMTGEAMHQVGLAGCASIEELQERLRARCAANADARAIVGGGWDHDKMGRLPTRWDLDAVEPTRPVFLFRVCTHIGVANTAALRLAGIVQAEAEAETKAEAKAKAGGEAGGEAEEQEGRYASATAAGGADTDADGKEGQPRQSWWGAGEIDRVGDVAATIHGIPAGTAAGTPTGVLREGSVPLVMEHLQETDEAVRRRYFEAAARAFVDSGLTAVQTNDSGAWAHYAAMAEAEALPLRVYLTIQSSEVGKAGAPASGQTCGALLRADRVKLFSDGALGAETAFLREPYVADADADGADADADGVDGSGSGGAGGREVASGGGDDRGAAASESPTVADPVTAPTASGGGEKPAEAGNRGILVLSREALLEGVSAARRAGFRLEVHAIGDAAAEAVLDAFAAAGITAAERPVLTHCQVLGPDLIRRMAAAGVVGNIQPSFVVTDAAWVLRRLRPHVARTSYAWRSMLAAGVHCAGGSDAPVETCSPLQGMHDAMFRGGTEALPAADEGEGGGDGHLAGGAGSATATRGTGGAAGDGGARLMTSAGFLPGERLSFGEALHLYTRGAAFAACEEGRLGRLVPGFAADFVVLDRDVAADPASLPRARVLQVWVDGVRRDSRRHDAGAAAAAAAGGRPDADVADGVWRPGKNGAPIVPCRCCGRAPALLSS